VARLLAEVPLPVPKILHHSDALGILGLEDLGDVTLQAHLGAVGLTETNFAKFQGWYDRYDFWIVFTCGFTPLPYKVCTISAGVAHISFIGFLVASAVSRSARFFIVAGLMGWKGESIRPVIDKYFNWLSLAFVALLIGGFLAVKWLH